MFGIIGGVLLALLAVGFVYEQAARRRAARRPLPGRLVELDGYRLHVTDMGQGGPPVVIVHGAGETAYSWLHVSREVARFTRVITYDRPGLGASDSGPAPDAVRSVEELRSLLTRTGVPGPYVLVGHSLGGLITRLYAVRYPAEVAGMVMVDSTHEKLKDDRKFRQSFAVLGVLLKVLRLFSAFGLPRLSGFVYAMYPERRFYAQQISRAEYQQWTDAICRNLAGQGGFREFDAAFPMMEAASHQIRSFGDLPLVVLTNPGFGTEWIAMQRELASRSTSGIHRVSDRPGHSLQMARPELVIAAIAHVLEQHHARAR